MKLIPLGGRRCPHQGFAKVDDEDYERLNQHKWSIGHHGYVTRFGGTRMHREVFRTASSLQVDHRNGDKLDNQKHNLRKSSHAQNQQNRPKNVNNTSGYKGVARVSGAKTYRAYITCNNKRYEIGHFDTARLAALAYDFWALHLHGEFAKTNFTAVRYR
jgi:hypothetical protein